MTLDEMLALAGEFEVEPVELELAREERQSFVERFPKASLGTMTVEEYADTKTKDCFDYWLEQKNRFGGVGGGNMSKYGIFRAATGEYCSGSGKNKVTLTGEALQTAFRQLRDGFVQALALAEEERYGEIQQLGLPVFNTVLLKVLHAYYPDRFLNVFTAPVLKKLGEALQVDPALFEPKRVVELNHTVYVAMKQQSLLASWSVDQLGRFVWTTFSDAGTKSDTEPSYWLAGHTYSSDGSQKDYFIQNGVMGIGFLREDLSEHLLDEQLFDYIESKEPDDKAQQALKAFFRIKQGDYVALKSTYTRKEDGVSKSVLKVSAIGRALADAYDGYRFEPDRGHLLPVDWTNLEEKEYIGYGGYRQTLKDITNRKNIELIFKGKQPAKQEEEKKPLSAGKKAVSHNVILFGPPGTGKTYEVSHKALELISDAQTFEELDNSGREAIQNEYTRLTRAGRISFVTFHQSYAYEDFIEGLRSDGKGNFVPEDGLFKRTAIEALYAGLKRNKQSLSDEVRFEQQYDYLVAHGKERGIQFSSKTGALCSIASVSPQGNLIISNDEATFESTISKERLLKIYRYVVQHNIDWKNQVGFIREAIGGSHETRFWSVFNWMMQRLQDEEAEDTGAETKPAVSDLPYTEKKAIVLKALQEDDAFDFTGAASYVVIIDEINRGNISKIFGELLTLLERDKRLTELNQLIVELPYTKERFTLPPNLSIIGTMNTADRSIALMDTALRRRFHFEEVMPKPELLDTVGSLDLEELLTVINQRIEVLYDRNHTIGHAYLMGVKTEEDVIEVVQHKIIPLLQEYFYDDWEKIGLILGGIGKSREDGYILYEEQLDYAKLFKQPGGQSFRRQYKVKSKITSQEIAAIYES
jgi:5-methylcytosine-specific restriction protein B